MDVASDPSTHRCVSGTGAWALTRWELDVSLDEPFAVFQRGSSPRLLSSQPFSSASREQAIICNRRGLLGPWPPRSVYGSGVDLRTLDCTTKVYYPTGSLAP
jgi:hypothetical protein